MQHIARHQVTPEEVDEALYDPRARLLRGRGGFYRLYARSEAGRMLLAVLVDEGGRVAGPVTARDMTDAERRRYFDPDC